MRIFSQVLKLIPRGAFDAAVRTHQAERNAKGFTSWGQLVAMLCSAEMIVMSCAAEALRGLHQVILCDAREMRRNSWGHSFVMKL